MLATATGAASAAFERLMARFAVGLRVGGAVAGGVGGLLGLAAPASPPVVGVAVAGLLGWAITYAVLTVRNGWSRSLVAGDIVVAAAICLGYSRLVPDAVPPGWSTWLVVVASSAVVIAQMSPWLRLGVVATVVVPAAYTAGRLLAGQPLPGAAVLLVAQGAGTAVLMGILRRGARAADVAIDRQEALHREAAVRAGRRAEEREHCRLLHDSVSATLTVVASGAVAASPTLRDQARRDLGVVERMQAPAGEPAAPTVVESPGDGVAGAGQADAGSLGPFGAGGALRSWLAPVVSGQSAVAVETEIADVVVPPPVAAAVAGAVAEVLRNVVRHAGVDRVRLRVGPANGVVRIELADDGCGFDPAQVPAHRRGLRESVLAPMSRVGGSAVITSRPGAGTRVVLQWPAVAGDSPDPVATNGAGHAGNGGDGGDGRARAAQHTRPTDGEADDSKADGGEAPAYGGFDNLVAGRYQRAFELAVVWLIAVRHVANALIAIISRQWAYRSFGAEMLAWALMAGVGAAGSVRLLRRRTGPVASWLLAVGVLAASALATAEVATRQELTAAHWAFTTTGWFGVLVLLRRPITELAALITINAGLTLGVLLRDGMTDRVSLTRFLMIVYVMAALQVGLTLVVKALDGTARRAATAAERQAAVGRRRQVAEALHRSRLDRYQTVRRSVAPLLVGLASGELDPGDRRIQRRCAVEASRLRRLFAETDDVPDPLLHELRACADIAYSRGVLVDLQVVGQLPALSLPVRRALTEAPLHVLAGAQRQARVTVLGRSNEVAVSVLADTRAGEPAELPTPSGRAVTVTMQEEEDGHWIEARWRR